VANFQRPWLKQMVAKHMPLFDHYEKAGCLIQPPRKKYNQDNPFLKTFIANLGGVECQQQ